MAADRWCRPGGVACAYRFGCGRATPDAICSPTWELTDMKLGPRWRCRWMLQNLEKLCVSCLPGYCISWEGRNRLDHRGHYYGWTNDISYKRWYVVDTLIRIRIRIFWNLPDVAEDQWMLYQFQKKFKFLDKLLTNIFSLKCIRLWRPHNTYRNFAFCNIASWLVISKLVLLKLSN